MSWMGKTDESQCLKFVENRWGQDIRYAVNSLENQKNGMETEI